MNSLNQEPNDNPQMVQTVGRAPALQAVDAVVFYDPQTGQVAHTHHVLTFEGAERRNPEEQVQSALEAAQRLGRDVENLKILHVPEFRPVAPSYRVDLEMLVLVEKPEEARPPKRKPARKRAAAKKGPVKRAARKSAKKTARRGRK